MVLVQWLVSGDGPHLYTKGLTQSWWSRPVTLEQSHFNRAHHQLIQPETQLKEYFTLVFRLI